MKIEVGAYEAKTKLPELLRGVQAGKRYTITHRGEAIADLVPAEGAKRHTAVEAVDQIKRFLGGKAPGKGGDVKAPVGEGAAGGSGSANRGRSAGRAAAKGGKAGRRSEVHCALSRAARGRAMYPAVGRMALVRGR